MYFKTSSLQIIYAFGFFFKETNQYRRAQSEKRETLIQKCCMYVCIESHLSPL